MKKKMTENKAYKKIKNKPEVMISENNKLLK